MKYILLIQWLYFQLQLPYQQIYVMQHVNNVYIVRAGYWCSTQLSFTLLLHCKAQLSVWRTLSHCQTLLYQFIWCVPNHRSGNKMKNILYHTARTVPKSNRKIIEITGKTYITTVRTVPKSNRKIIEVKGKIPHCQNSS